MSPKAVKPDLRVVVSNPEPEAAEGDEKAE